MEFKDHFEQLNDEQKAAASHTEGPLLVIAGPGTGKTQLLSSRVAYILENTDTKAKNILCLTFTNKAAINMHERIIRLTDGGAHEVSVKTFHSFASEIMNMYPDYFWNSARLSTAPDAVQQEIIQTILSQLPLDNPLALKFAGKFTVTEDVKKALKLTKEAGLTPDKLRAILQANLAYIDIIEPDLAEITAERLSAKNLGKLQTAVHALQDQPIDTLIAPLQSLSTVLKDSLDHAISLDAESGKTSNTGEWKKQWIQTIDGQRGMFKERAKNEWWLHLADVYESYRDALHQRGYYDYSDMLVEVLTQIERHPNMRADIQERYLYVMIDEFQDTNAAQLRLAHLVADHHTSDGKPNIMAVGDDDQSIFKFNGAELNNLLSFKKSYPTCKTIVLTDNYRSTQAVLDLADTVISEAEDRLVNRDTSITKRLEAKKSPPAGKLIHYSFRTAEEQCSQIARDIKQHFSKDTSIAVIARGHESLKNIASRLLAINVPVHYEQQQNILEHQLVCQATYLAEMCYAITSGDKSSLNACLAKTLPHPMWRIDAKTLWQLALQNYRNPDWINSLEKSTSSDLQSIALFLYELAKLSANESLPVIIEYILGLRSVGDLNSPLFSYFAKRNTHELNQYLHGLSAMQYLRSLATEFSASQSATIKDFVNFLHLEQENETVVTDESPFVSGPHAVSLLSVHKAKGLEFDRVYIIDAVEKNWQPRKGGRKPPSNLPLQPTGDDMDDYIRLMFVALTRAKQFITVSSYRFDSKNADVLPSPIISGALPPIEYPQPIDDITILQEALTWPRLEKSDEKLILKQRLEEYSLSVTHLLNFLDVTDCGPEKYLERNILCLPAAKSAYMSHGTAMHAALEYAQRLVNSDDFSIAKVQHRYLESLKNEHLPIADFTRYSIHGKQQIEKLFNAGLLHLEKGSVPEQRISGVSVGQARLSGTLDRIDQDENTVTVIDYKTGNPLPNFSTSNQQLQVKAWKHRTQLIFYAMLLRRSPRFEINSHQVLGQMIYLNADSSKELIRTYEPTDTEIARLEKLVQAVWRKIMNIDLPDITKYPQDYSGILEFEEDLLKA